MAGAVSVSFRREPDYFAGSAVQGESVQVIVCIDDATGKLVGMGSRALRHAYVNGEVQRIGYLSDLRGDARYRGGTLLARGYRYLRELHLADPVPVYYSMILEGNTRALENLTKERCGLPRYDDLGRFLTPLLRLEFPKPPVRVHGVSFHQATAAQLPEILDFVGRRQAQKQFAPRWSVADFGSPRLRGLSASDFYLAIRDHRIVGTLAAWDQGSFRQTHVERYSTGLRLLRPFYNGLARLTPAKSLPAPGERIAHLYLAFAAVEDDSPEVFRGLLRSLYRDRRGGPWHYLVAGLHERDPLAPVLDEYRRIPAAGRLFAVRYPQDTLGGLPAPARVGPLDDCVPYVEIATI